MNDNSQKIEKRKILCYTFKGFYALSLNMNSL